ncbi:MAG TPA: glycosyltransferase family 2 protein, partial [Anaerolineae bacterium]|nr:glycosyltransferase family 2 protein [Anaerolineae bacterium]
MKLIIQIPCLNEEETLPQVLAELPTQLAGIDVIETLVIDDGSTDNTVAIARANGATHVVSHPCNLGLAKAFQTGLDTCLRLGADIIVHTDADNQYPARYIEALIRPILIQKADLVIGNRPIEQIAHFSPFKRFLQRLGSRVVRTVSGTNVPDTVSGFRAYSRETALRLQMLTRFSYTLETIIHAGQLGLTIENIDIEVNDPTRESRLAKNNFSFVRRQAATILRLYAFYEPLRTFFYLSLPFFMLGIGFVLRFVIRFLTTNGNAGLIQSVVIGTGLFVVAVLVALIGILADIIAKHRQLTEEMLYRLKKMELEKGGRE